MDSVAVTKLDPIALADEHGVEDDSYLPVGEITDLEQARLDEIETSQAVRVFRDWEGILVAESDDIPGEHSVYVFDNGEVGHTGLNHPATSPTLRELLADQKV